MKNMEKQKKGVSRREFLSASLGTVAGAAAISVLSGRSLTAQTSSAKKRVVLVGTGIRGSTLWGKTLIENYGDLLDMVGLCDNNSGRMSFAKGHMQAGCPTYRDTEFDRMIAETKPDLVIVTTRDCYHAKYICRAMELGCDVLTEKPMATDEAMCQHIVDTEKRTGRRVTVTFNYRYGPDAVKIKEILLSNEIGQVTSVDFNYYLDIHHGASYFRRWHAFKQFSGSLLVHKATHHYDLMNWWLAAEPVQVNAWADLRKYGFNGTSRHTRCMGCPHKTTCSFYWDITRDPFLMKLYVEPESEDGYIRDACVFREKINIWDTMAVQVRYHNDVLMSYSLNAFMPYEGYFVAFNGTEGRLEARVYHNQPWKPASLAEFRLTRNFKDSRTFNLGSGGGGHWGADPQMQDRIFRNPGPDTLSQNAGIRDGAMSILIGIAGRRSVERNRPVFIEELVTI
jgi:predicted dehydrogenase